MADLVRLRPPVDPSTTVLFICDMQNDVVDSMGEFAKHGAQAQPKQALIPVIGRVLTAARQAGMPVFYTRVVNRRDGVGQSIRDSREIGALMEGSWGADIVATAGEPAELLASRIGGSRASLAPISQAP